MFLKPLKKNVTELYTKGSEGVRGYRVAILAIKHFKIRAHGKHALISSMVVKGHHIL